MCFWRFFWMLGIGVWSLLVVGLFPLGINFGLKLTAPDQFLEIANNGATGNIELASEGRDVGAILIEEGLAVPFICGATHCPKTPRPWCQQD